MSMGSEKNPLHISPVDVDSSVIENVENNEKSCDSGVESSDSCSATLPSSSNCEGTPMKSPETDVLVDFRSGDEKTSEISNTSNLTTAASLCPDLDDATENLPSLDEFSLNNIDTLTSDCECNYETKNDLNLKDTSIDNTEVDLSSTAGSSTTDSNNDLQSTGLISEEKSKIPDIKLSNLQITNTRTLATSTASLNEQNTNSNNSMTIAKSQHSRSADNISTIEQNVQENLNSSTKELNTEKILSEFAAQKNIVAATQKVTLDVVKNLDLPQNLDAKYTRIPKELLSQDLGSIVKNVHGIFSSVSGSLKYAYNHSQRLPKPPIKHLPKPIPNGKLMDDIFEDITEKSSQNGVDSSPVKTEVPGEHKSQEAYAQEEKETDETKKDILKLQIESLERVLAEQRRENSSLRERVKQQVDDMQEKDQVFKELEVKVDLMSKRVEQAEREKDAAVMRYASVECAAIEAKRAAERASEKERAAMSETELLNNKLRSAASEKQRICQLYDDKCHELSTCERELSKVREDVKELEGRLKWTQSKLRMEMDAYKESAERAEKLSQQVSELEAARDTAITNATDSARAKQLELDLKQSQAALILCRHEKEELERRLSTATQQLDTCRRERDSASGALTLATAEVEQLKISNLRLEEEAAELAALRAQAALADTLSAQLQRESDRASQAEETLNRERARAETCARREAAALEHAARLTAQHVQHRASTADTQNKAQALALDNASLRERISYLEAECTRLQNALSEESDKRNKETRALARKVAELTEEVCEAQKKLEWEQGENSVLKKKHNNAIKELNRELHRTVKRCEQLEAKLSPPDNGSTRTGSVSSLSSGESAPQDERIQNGHSDTLPDIQVREPDRQQLIERIVSLQRAAARRAERCEFLEEHSRQLTAELRGKSRLLRHLLSSLPAGAVASSHSDAHKKEIARLGGGAMAAVWGGDSAGMTLELSLEINNKLQAVLEDALLKNITLKENMDTLGEEIARLKEQMNLTKNDNSK